MPHIARCFSREVCTPPRWCDTPPWYLVSPGHICAIPHFATYRAIFVRYPMKTHRVLQGAPPRGRQLYFTFPYAPDPLFKASKAPFLTLRVATPSKAPRQGPLEKQAQKSLAILSLQASRDMKSITAGPLRQAPLQTCLGAESSQEMPEVATQEVPSVSASSKNTLLASKYHSNFLEYTSPFFRNDFV